MRSGLMASASASGTDIVIGPLQSSHPPILSTHLPASACFHSKRAHFAGTNASRPPAARATPPHAQRRCRSSPTFTLLHEPPPIPPTLFLFIIASTRPLFALCPTTPALQVPRWASRCFFAGTSYRKNLLARIIVLCVACCFISINHL